MGNFSILVWIFLQEEVPSIEKQRKIVDNLEIIEKKICENKNELERLKSLNSSVLHKYIV